jgi:hypothetical protein
MAAYADQADFEAFVEGWVTTDAAALDRLLERASDDVDSILGAYDVIETGTYAGRKIDPTDDAIGYADGRALVRATCAQAEYRNAIGERQLARPLLHGVGGPDFSHTNPVPHIGPKTWRELSGSDLLRNRISIGRQATRPPWYGFSYNDPDEF